jgi:hypothetical protein
MTKKTRGRGRENKKWKRRKCLLRPERIENDLCCKENWTGKCKPQK